MKVLLLRPQIEAGGAGRVIIQLVAGLKESGVEIEIATAGGEWLPKLEQLVTCHYVPLYPSTPRNLLKSIWHLRKIVLMGKYDLLNPHHRFASLVCNLLPIRKSETIPIVSTVHEIKTDRTIFSQLAFASHVIVFSKAVKQNLVYDHNLHEQNIFIVPMGIDIVPPQKEQLANVKQTFSLNDNIPTVSCITRLSSEKGCDIFIKAAALICARGIDARFLLVGDGPQKNELDALADELDVKPRLQFTGWRDDIPAIIGNSNFLVLPSMSEAVGIAIIEGMGLGKPTIAAKVGGIPDVIDDSVTGLLVAPGDPEALANAMIVLIEDLSLCQQLGIRAQKSYEEQFSLRNMVSQTIKAYDYFTSCQV